MRDIAFIPDVVKKKRRAARVLYDGHVGKPTESEKPLHYPKHDTVWWDKQPFMRRGRWCDTWRNPNGTFAKRPKLGERARRLGLL